MNTHTRALSSLLSTPHTSASAEARTANAAATPTAEPGMDFASLMGARVQATQSAQASAAQRQPSAPADTSHRSNSGNNNSSSSTNATAQDQARALNERRERERVQDRAADHRAQQAAAAARQQAARPAGSPSANAGRPAATEAQATEGENENNTVASDDRQLTTTPLAEWLASLNPATMQLAPATGESAPSDSLAATAGEEPPVVAGAPQRNATGLRRSGAHAAGTGAEGEATSRLAAPNERFEWPAQMQAAQENQAATGSAGTAGAGPVAAKSNADAMAAAVTNLTDPTAGASPAAEAPAATAVDVPTPATDADFPDVLATQVSVLVKDGVQRAELHLNPAEMGPISVQIAVDGSQAQVDFAATAGATRELIENSLPMLAAALHEAGLTLAGGGVFEHGRHAGGAGHDGASPSSQRGNGNGRDTGTLEGTAASQQPAARRVAHRGMLDLYA